MSYLVDIWNVITKGLALIVASHNVLIELIHITMYNSSP